MAGLLKKKWFFSSSGDLGRHQDKQPEVTDMYSIGKELGTGTFGVVRAVKSKESGESYALKTINKEKLDDHQMKYLEAECQVLKRIDGHGNIVKLHEIYDTPKKLHIVMELVTGGQLLERLATKGLYSEATTAQCIRSITDAIGYCHEKGVVHRDLKPENILLSDDTDDADIKLADFGLSKLYNAETEMMFTQCGTPEFVAPEVMAGSGYTSACDIGHWVYSCTSCSAATSLSMARTSLSCSS